nr:putative reverse transcriptase domain, reverse transcriptase zinc-binding domain protein [Tanacetum cinerariifolium]
GDPLSPYLFTLVMEVFNLVSKREIAMSPFFRYHWLCKELKLAHLCFVDDLLLLCNGDSNSVAVLKSALKEFKGSLSTLVVENQSAFIPSRQISDNILLSQELMRNYHRNRGPAKCAPKIDIRKAYDSVEWEFLANCLKHFGFH